MKIGLKKSKKKEEDCIKIAWRFLFLFRETKKFV